MTNAGPVRRAAAFCRAELTRYLDADWNARAGDLEWSCHTTLAHMLSALVYYSVNLVTRSRKPRGGGQTNAELSVEDMLDVLEGRAALLAFVIENTPAEARAAQSYGISDPYGFVAMACDELLIHTDDIVGGLGGSLAPPPDLARVPLERLFPWAPPGGDPWETLRWANGRAELGDRPRLGGEWVWWSAPLGEWDGRDPNASI